MALPGPVTSGNAARTAAGPSTTTASPVPSAARAHTAPGASASSAETRPIAGSPRPATNGNAVRTTATLLSTTAERAASTERAPIVPPGIVCSAEAPPTAPIPTPATRARSPAAVRMGDAAAQTPPQAQGATRVSAMGEVVAVVAMTPTAQAPTCVKAEPACGQSAETESPTAPKSAMTATGATRTTASTARGPSAVMATSMLRMRSATRMLQDGTASRALIRPAASFCTSPACRPPNATATTCATSADAFPPPRPVASTARLRMTVRPSLGGPEPFAEV